MNTEKFKGVFLLFMHAMMTMEKSVQNVHSFWQNI